MNTRMAKYDNEEVSNLGSRVKKHANLYDEINKTEINNLKIRSNATVIGNQEPEIDIEKIKKILDTKYKDAPRKSIRLEEDTEETDEEEVPTKEYDLNVFLEKAKDEKEESYEEVRSKKLRDTQFDILKNLHIEEPKEEKSGPKPEDNDLLNLINTITINEAKEKTETIDETLDEDSTEKDDEESDIFSQVSDNISDSEEKEEDNTNSIEEIKNEIEKVEATSKVMKTQNNVLDNSFYTSSNIFTKKDLKKDSNDDDKINIWLKIVLVLIFLGILVGLFFFIKSIINF